MELEIEGRRRRGEERDFSQSRKRGGRGGEHRKRKQCALGKKATCWTSTGHYGVLLYTWPVQANSVHRSDRGKPPLNSAELLKISRQERGKGRGAHTSAFAAKAVQQMNHDCPFFTLMKPTVVDADKSERNHA